MYDRHCPNCNADLRGGKIPQELLESGCYGPDATHFYRTIGVYSIEQDRTVAWQCPDCGYEWDR